MALFNEADTEKSGKIGGAQAVQFFSRSKLPMPALKNVWTVADQPPTNYLDHFKFATAVRLIQFVQNGAKGQGANLATPPGVTLRPAHFEGVTGVTVQPPPEVGGGGSAPPQQQQQQPPQQQKQQQQPPPMRGPTPPMCAATPSTPPRPRAPSGPGSPAVVAATSTALATQDPYSLGPNEQARYEDLFPKYAAEDGFVYGKAAVELFSKSGLPQPQLAAIWNMVDAPVDNRLDKLEFAMAMHLIVCVSRKKLPLPATLPGSLQQLKAQQKGGPPAIQRVPAQESTGSPAPARGPSPAIGGGPALPMRGPSPAMREGGGPPQQQQQQPSPRMGPTPGGGPPPPMRGPSPMGGGPPPSQQQQRMPSPTMVPTPTMGSFPQQQMPSPSYGAMNQVGSPPPGGPQAPPPQEQMPSPKVSPQAPPMDSRSMPGPPPLETGGGLSISDAFEGLSTSAVDTRSYASAPPVMEPSSFSNFSLRAPSPAPIPEAPSPPAVSTIPEPDTSAPPRAAPAPAPASSAALANSYQMGSQAEEAVKLKATLQKLQAENVSLKAQLGSLSEDELQMQKEVNATVAEISKLSQELTTLRAQVLAAKSRLLEATAELKANHEKKQ